MPTKKRLNEFYLEYGKFITKFEFGCQVIRMTIGEAAGFGMNMYDIDIKDILLEGLTARPLVDKLYAIYVFKYPDETLALQKIKKMKNLFTDLIEIRNTLSHGVIDLNDIVGRRREKDHIFRLTHHKIKAYGFDENLKRITPEKLRELNENLDNLNLCISVIDVLVKPNFPDHLQWVSDVDSRLPNIKFKLDWGV